MATLKISKSLASQLACALLLSLCHPYPAIATAALDDGSNEEGGRSATPDTAPPAVSPESTPSEAPPEQTNQTRDPQDPNQTLHSVRLPLGVAGSVLPQIHTGQPAAPRIHANLPLPSSPRDTRPLSWRATAEAIKTQTPSSTLFVMNWDVNFKTTYNSLLDETQSSNWTLAAQSLPAGHFLFGIPKPNYGSPGDSQGDFAAWVVLSISPLSDTSTELRAKIQGRHARNFSNSVSEFLQRSQLRAKGNKLL